MKNMNCNVEYLLSKCEIKPNPTLKAQILQKAQAITPEKIIPVKFPKRIAVTAACLLLAFLSVFCGIALWNENYMQVYIDVNPSIVLSLNRFGIVVDADYINQDAVEYFRQMSFKGKKAEDAIEEIMQSLNQNGYLDNSEMYISITCKNEKQAERTQQKLESKANSVKSSRGYSVNINRGRFRKDEIVKAKELNLSPIKYKLISDIIAIDGSYSMESLRDMSMKDLKEILTSLNDSKKPEGNENSVKSPRGNSDNTNRGGFEKDEKEKAKELKIPPGKYKLISDIIEIDGSYSVESLREKSMKDLKDILKTLRRKKQ